MFGIVVISPALHCVFPLSRVILISLVTILPYLSDNTKQIVFILVTFPTLGFVVTVPFIVLTSVILKLSSWSIIFSALNFPSLSDFVVTLSLIKLVKLICKSSILYCESV